MVVTGEGVCSLFTGGGALRGAARGGCGGFDPEIHMCGFTGLRDGTTTLKIGLGQFRPNPLALA
jgi:hypothetical protein